MKVPLAFLPEDKEATVIEVTGGKGLVRRLCELGFTPGAKIKILSSNSPGPVLVNVNGSRIALGKGVAMKIIVDLE